MNDNEKSKIKTLLWMITQTRNSLIASEFLAKEISAPDEVIEKIKASLKACEEAGKIAEDFNKERAA